MVKVLALAVLVSVSLSASIIVQSVPDFDGPTRTSGFPAAPDLVGTFLFGIPAGEGVVFATLGGTWGTHLDFTSTAGVDLYLDGVFIGACPPLDAGCWQDGDPFRPFTFVLPAPALAALADGTSVLTAVQTNEFVIRLGKPTLTIETAAVSMPEPSTVLLSMGGLALMIGWRRRLRRSS